jgi:O-antigen/teichoic acid export membrane protein
MMEDTQGLAVNLKDNVKRLGTEEARHRFSVNIVSNLVLFATGVFINFWITPFLIGKLGIAVYGLIPLSQTIISYGAILITSLNSALGRFLTIDLGNRDDLNANRTFNTALFFLLASIGVLSPIFIIISVFFPHLFNVPLGWNLDSSWLSATIAISFILGIITSNFSVFPFIYSKFLLSNLINFACSIVRTGLIILSYSFYPAHLWYFGASNVIASLLSLFGFVLIWRNLTPEVKIQPKAFDRTRLFSMVGMGGWLTINTLGAMLLNRVDLIAVNIYFGAVILGGYAAVSQFSTFLDTLITSLCTVLRPVLMIKYAQQDYEGLCNVTNQSIKLLGLMLGLIVGLLCGFSRPLISIWLGSSFQYLSLVLIVLTAHYSINLAVRPLVFVQQAYNQVRWPGIITIICGVGNLVVDILIGIWGKWGYMGIAVSTALIWTIRNTFFTTIYTAHVMKLPWWTFLTNLKTVLVATILVGVASFGLTEWQMPNNWFSLGIFAAIISVPYTAVVWFLIFNRSERKLIIGLLPFKSIKKIQVPE